jgi:hypothetical protein
MLILLNTPFRTGSTWTFNVLRDILNSLDIKYISRMHSRTFDSTEEDENYTIKIIKAHDSIKILEDFSEKEKSNIRYITCLRDPAEIISSLNRVKYWQLSDEDIKNTIIILKDILEHVLKYIENGGIVLILDYNDIKDNSVKVYMQIIDYLGIAPKNIEQIIENNSREANLNRLKSNNILDKDFEDIEPNTLWHGNHIAQEGYDLTDLSNFKEEMNQLNILYRTLLQKRDKDV